MILNVYKPKTWTSFDVVAQLKGLLKVKKIGHAGTLDPLAEGVLVVLTEADTKRQSEIMGGKKEYLAEVSFGAESPTYDLEFKPVVSDRLETDCTDLSAIKSRLMPELVGMLGDQDQKAPAFSAKKLAGNPLYLKARKGKVSETELPVKRITIYKLELVDFYMKELETDRGLQKLPTAKLLVECSSGTYIRSIAHDLGKKLGCGAVMSSLIRTKVGDFKLEDSQRIEDFSRV